MPSRTGHVLLILYATSVLVLALGDNCKLNDIKKNPFDCNSFLMCNESGQYDIFDCPLGMRFNSTEKRCDWAGNVKCSNFQEPEEDYGMTKEDWEYADTFDDVEKDGEEDFHTELDTPLNKEDDKSRSYEKVFVKRNAMENYPLMKTTHNTSDSEHEINTYYKPEHSNMTHNVSEINSLDRLIYILYFINLLKENLSIHDENLNNSCTIELEAQGHNQSKSIKEENHSEDTNSRTKVSGIQQNDNIINMKPNYPLKEENEINDDFKIHYEGNPHENVLHTNNMATATQGTEGHSNDNSKKAYHNEESHESHYKESDKLNITLEGNYNNGVFK